MGGKWSKEMIVSYKMGTEEVIEKIDEVKK